MALDFSQDLRPFRREVLTREVLYYYQINLHSIIGSKDGYVSLKGSQP